MPKVRGTISLIEDKYVLPAKPKYGQRLSDVYELIGNSSMLGEHAITVNTRDLSLLHQDMKSFSQHIIANLKECFSDESIYKSFNTIFNCQAYPSDRSLLLEYGKEDLINLSQHYSQLFSPLATDSQSVLLSEWELFKYMVYENHKKDNLIKVCQLALSQYQEDYPNITLLAAVCLVLPASSVDCERGFSQQNLIKTKQRNQLESNHLDMLLRLKIEGPPVSEFPFQEAISAWKKAAKRLYI